MLRQCLQGRRKLVVAADSIDADAYRATAPEEVGVVKRLLGIK
jgi:hypothetical protein